MNRVDGKVALITGAARGIGLRSAQLLAQAGAKVVLTDILDASSSAEAIGDTALFLIHDVTQEDEWKSVVEETENRFGLLDILVNNAGIFFYQSLETMTLEEWRRISAINLDGVFLGTQAALRSMKKRPADADAASIINLSSIAGLVGSPNASAYHMTKGGVRLFTKACALECAQLGYKIRVNSVHPGVIDTEMGDKVVNDAADNNEEAGPEEIRAMLTELHPLGRFGTVDDIAKAILFLASNDSAFMTGTEFVVDGGLTAR